MCRASLQQLLDSGRPLHARLRPVTLRLHLMPPPPPPGTAVPAAAVVGGGGGGGVGLAEGWYGSTAVMSYFLSELGRCYTVNTLSLEVGEGCVRLAPTNGHACPGAVFMNSRDDG